MKLTTHRWQKKKQRRTRNAEGKEMDLITGKHFARSNPGMFQEKLLATYNEILNAIKRRYPEYFLTFFLKRNNIIILPPLYFSTAI